MIKVGKVINCKNCGKPQELNIPIPIARGMFELKAEDHECGPNWTPKIYMIVDGKKRRAWQETVKKLIGYLKS